MEETRTNELKPNPSQEYCWSLYINPESETFGNAYQSAIKAGYTDNTATIITSSNWFKEKLRRLNRSDRAVKNLEEVIELKKEEMLDEKGMLRTDLLKHRSEVSTKILEVTDDEWNIKKKIDVTSKDKQVVGITYVVPNDKE
jgi:phage terminase small subunit